MKFRLLGPLEVIADDGRVIALPAAKPRALLALLLLNRNQVARTDTLVDELWEERPPATAVKTLQVYVSQLRKAVGTRLETRSGGYLLHVEPGELDTDDFEQLSTNGEWREALALWRGPALADVRGERFANTAAERLEELRLAVLEERIESDLADGRHAALVGELEQLAEAHPLRERLRAQLMLALYRSGRQAEALDVYRETRQMLADELGLEPGQELRELEQAILRQDESLVVARRARERPDAQPRPVVAERRGRTLLAVLAFAALAAIAIGGAYLVSRTHSTGEADLRTFAVKVENVLAQARDGRIAVRHAVDKALRCETPLKEAAGEIEDVTANRNSLLQQIAALNVPDDDSARRSASLLQRAAAASFAADVGYRRDLLRATRCPPQIEPAAGARADRLKSAFVSAFNPLAARFGLTTWSANDF